MSDEALQLETDLVTARLVPNRGTNGGFSLVIDGTTQSHVNPADPGDLQLEYVRLVAGIVNGTFVAAQPLRILVLGGGALTLPRYFGATRPGSRQHVVELHRPLLEFVLDTLPLDPELEVSLEFRDARSAVESAAQSGAARYDAAIVDVFAGAEAPYALTTHEFFSALRSLLAPGGLVIVNTLATHGLNLSREVTATLREFSEDVVALAAPPVITGESHGNVVIAAADRRFDDAAILNAVPAGPRPIAVLQGESLTEFVAGAPIRFDGASD
jgi:spermidine synthase